MDKQVMKIPTKDTILGLRITMDLRKRLEWEAGRRGMRLSRLVRHVLTEFVKPGTFDL